MGACQEAVLREIQRFSSLLYLSLKSCIMKKFLLFAAFILILAAAGFGQAYESTIQYDKKKQTALTIEYTYPPEAVENAFIAKMGRLGFKPKEEKGFLNRDKGFIVFKNAYIPEISEKRFDYIIKAERKSRKEKDETIFYVLINRDENNALNSLDAYSIGEAKSYLNNMLPDIEEANLELEIKAQEELVAKAEKKFRDLVDEQADLEKKLDNNLKAQEETRKDIDAQKKSLDALTGKRKRSD